MAKRTILYPREPCPQVQKPSHQDRNLGRGACWRLVAPRAHQTNVHPAVRNISL